MFATAERATELPTEHLEAEVAQLWARISAETCEWLGMVAELERRGAYLDAGCVSLAHWLSIHCGIGLRTAQEHVRVALRLEELPEIRAAFSSGELTYSKARALTRIADSENERELLELALDTSAAQLERIVRAYRRALPPQELEELWERRYLSVREDEDGAVVLNARLAPEEGALLLRALEAAREELRRERTEELRRAEAGGLQDPKPAADGAEALTRVAELALQAAARDTSRSGAERTLLHLHVDAATLARAGAGSTDARAEAEGIGLADDTLRRLGCDTAVVAITESAGKPLSVGRRTRTVQARLRRALDARDGRCRFPGCVAKRFLDAHHIHHWADGGETSLDNLVSLCRHHHRLLHEGRFRIRRLGEGRLSFESPSGVVLRECARPPSIPRAALARAPAEPHPKAKFFGYGIAPCSARCGGEKLDLDLTLFCLMQRFDRPGVPGEGGASPAGRPARADDSAEEDPCA